MHHHAEQSDATNGDHNDRPTACAEDDATESTPLFADNPRRPGGRTLHVPKVHNPDLIVGIFCAVVLVGSASGGLWIIPTTRKVEDIICRHYYDALSDESIDESLCKEDVIQSKVAYIFAVYGALQASIGAFCAFPWGIVADRLGRKRVFSLSILGMCLDQAWFAAVCAFPKTLPVEALWFGPTFLVLGGGNAVLGAVVFSMLADVTTSENRAKSFMRVHLSSMVGNLCAPAVAGWMMEKTGPWPVMGMAYVGFLSMMFAIHIVPETKPAAQVSDDPIEEEAETRSPTLGAIQHTLLRLKESLALFQSPSLVILLVATLSTYPVLLSTLQFMSIFASKRYHVSLSQTGYLSSLYGTGVFLSVVLVLPAFSKLLASPKTPKTLRIPDDHQRDLFLARFSSLALLMGSLSMSASPTIGAFIGGLAILSLGTGWGSYIRSVSSVFVDPAHRTRLFSIISLVETAGQTYAQAMLAGLFSLGMRMGGLWIGLPYLGVAALCLMSLTLLLLVRLPPSEGKTLKDDGESSVQP